MKEHEDCIDAGLALARAESWCEYFRGASQLAREVAPLRESLATLEKNVQDAKQMVEKDTEMGPVMRLRFKSIEEKITHLGAVTPHSDVSSIMTGLQSDAVYMAAASLKVQIAETAPFIIGDCACNACRE